MISPLDSLRLALEELVAADEATLAEAESTLRAWLQARVAHRPRGDLFSDLPARFGMVGASAPMQEIFGVLERIIPTDAPVLVLGESGTGKELIARALHREGPRRRKPMISVNCAAIPATLLEAELFGHKKGSFTGAHRDRRGYCVAADGGTLFLDEIGDLPLELQPKLLRFLQDGEVRPVGGNQAVEVDVRVVAATNRDIAERVREKLFREDLYYRLAVVTLTMPSLRERKEDIPHLVEYLLARHAADGMPMAEFEPPALERIAAYDWPGNIRQLDNELLRCAAMAGGEPVGLKSLSPEVRGGG